MRMAMKVSIAAIAGGLAIVGTVSGGVFLIEDRYHKVADADKDRAEITLEANEQKAEIIAQIELVGRRLDGKIELDRWYRNAAALRSYKVYTVDDCKRYKKRTKRGCVNLFRQRRDIEQRLRSMGIPIPRVE